MLTKRQTDLLLVLLQTDDFLTSSDLAKKLDVSTKTVKREIKELNEQLEFKDIHILGKRGAGFKLSSVSKDNCQHMLLELRHSKEHILPNFQKERVDWLLDQCAWLTLDNVIINQQDLANQLFVSISTLKNDLEKVKCYLANYQLTLTRYKNVGLHLEGSEQNIRAFIRDRFTRNMTSNESPIRLDQSFDTEKLEKILKQLFETYGIYMTDVGFINLVMHLEILIKRVQTSTSLDFYEPTSHAIDQQSAEYQCSKEIVKSLQSIYHINIPKEELYNVYFHLSSQKMLRRNQYDTTNQQILLYKQILLETLAKINTLYQYDFTKDQLLIEGLLVHLSSSMKRINYQIFIKNDLLEDIQHSYPFEMQLAQLLANQLMNYFKVDVPINEVGFLALHFCGARERYQKREEQLQVLLVCTTGIGTSILLKTKIQANFSQSIHVVDTVSYYHLEKYDLSGIDLIISTIPLEKQLTQVPSIYVSPLVTEDELQKIKGYVHQKKLPLIWNILDANNFWIDVKAESREEAITIIGERFAENLGLNEQIIQEALAREKLGTTEIGNLVAIPHMMSDHLAYSHIAVGVLKEPIKWEYQEVQLVIFILISTNGQEIIQDIMLELYEQLSSKETVQQIIHSKDFYQFKELFLGGK